jgi:SPP1 gp7 family putative phage head morphogenesis protein
MAVTLQPLAPADAVRGFESKGYKLGFAWQDVWHEEHNRAFTVAKAMRYDILEDIRRSVDSAIRDGKTFGQFSNELTPILQAKGWWGRQRVTDPATGESKIAQLGSPRRLRTIFDVNLRTSYAAGRWARIQRVKEQRPYLRYVAVQDARTRPEHAEWHGTILPADDPWWETHYPPNGWNCRCTVQQLSKRDLDRYGYEVDDEAPAGSDVSWTNPRTGEVVSVPEGVDPGFGYNAGVDYWRALTPGPAGEARELPIIAPQEGRSLAHLPPLPATRRAAANRLLPPGLSDSAYVDRFLKEFGGSADTAVPFTDKAGETLAISDRLFRDAEGRLKVTKRGRERHLLLLADAIKEPDEIWLQWTEYPKGELRLLRTYIARFDLAGQRDGGYALFRTGKDGWTGVTGFRPDRESYLQNRRKGTLIYRRK